MIDVELSESIYDIVSRDEFDLICKDEEKYFSERELLSEVESLGF